MSFVAALVHDTSTGFISRQSEKDTGPRNRRLQLRIPPGAGCPLAAAVCLPKRWIGITQSSASTSSGQAATNPKLQITCVSYSSYSYTRFMQKFYRTRIWPRGPMDKASAYGAGDCRFESCRGHCSTMRLCFTQDIKSTSQNSGRRFCIGQKSASFSAKSLLRTRGA